MVGMKFPQLSAPVALHTRICVQAAQAAAPSGRPTPAQPMRPFPAQPLRSESQARAASHAAASTSSSGNLAAGHKRTAGSADASGGVSGNARLGKHPQPQAPPRKKPRVQAHPPSVHDVTGVATKIYIFQADWLPVSMYLYHRLSACLPV